MHSLLVTLYIPIYLGGTNQGLMFLFKLFYSDSYILEAEIGLSFQVTKVGQNSHFSLPLWVGIHCILLDKEQSRPKVNMTEGIQLTS